MERSEKIAYIKSKVDKAVEKNGSIRGLCPFHKEDIPSFIYDMENENWKCFACGKKGGTFIKLYAMLEGIDEKIVEEAFKSTYTEKAKSSISRAVIKRWNKILFELPEILKYCKERRAWDENILLTRQIGFDLNRITIPIFDIKGNPVNIRFYDIFHKQQGYKMLSHPANKASLYIYPIDILLNNKVVFLCEGEPDTLAGLSLGLSCITLTGGATSFDPKLSRFFEGKIVYIMYDNDTAGREGAIRIKVELLPYVKNIAIVSLPVVEDKGDLTDFIVKYGAAKEQVFSLINECSLEKSNNDYETLKLGQISFHKYEQKRIETEALIVGKEADTYIVPTKIQIVCNKGEFKECSVCPFMNEEIINVSLNNMILAQLMGQRKDRFLPILKKELSIPCKRFNYLSIGNINLTEVQLMPSVESDEPPIILYAIARKFNLESNFVYNFKGQMIAHPETQLATFFIEEARILEDNITTYQMPIGIKQKLIKLLAKEDKSEDKSNEAD